MLRVTHFELPADNPEGNTFGIMQEDTSVE